MIERNKDVLEWALLGSGLHEAHEHLGDLIKAMNSESDFDEISFGIKLEHIYAHLNQAWNGRDKKGDWSDADFDNFSKYPTDLPDGTWPPHENA